MKKNKMMRIASVLLVAVLLSTCAISGTFAKYTSTVEASATAAIATWDVKIAGGTETFSLIDTWEDTYTEGNGGNVTENLLAPGTSGSFDLEVTNSSQVAAKYTVEMDYGNLAGVVNFTIDGEEVDLTDIEIGIGATHVITIEWEWPFEGDTDLALAGGDANVSATVTFEQVD